MAGKKSMHTEARWRGILERQAASGLSVRRYCATEGVSEPSFYAWRRKLRGGKRRGVPASQRTVPEKASDEPSLFVPLQLVDLGGSLEIVHPRGYRIQVSGDVNPVALRRVLEAIEERAGR